MAQKKYLKTACMIFLDRGGRTATQNSTDDWMDTASNGEVTSSTFLRGAGHEVYLNALLARGHATSAYTLAGGTTTAFPTLALNTTQAVIDFCTMFDVVLLGNAPSRSLVQAIKRKSRRPDGTKVGIYFTSLTSVPHKGNRNIFFDPLDTALANSGSGILAGNAITAQTYTSTIANPAVFTVTGAAPIVNQPVVLSGAGTGFTNGVTYYMRNVVGQTCNLAAAPGGAGIQGTGIGSGNWLIDGRPTGCTAIDQAQIAGSGGASITCAAITAGGGVSTHTWLVKMSDVASTGTFVNALGVLTNNRYQGDLDLVLFDNCNPTRYTGDATNYTGSAGETADNNATTGYVPKLREVLVSADAKGAQYGLTMARNGQGHAIRGDTILTGGTFGTFENGAKPHWRYQEHFKGASGTPSGTPETFANIKAYCDAATRGGYVNLLDFTYSSQRGASSDGTNFNAGTRNNSERWAYNDSTATNAQQYQEGPGIISTVDYGDMRRLAQYLKSTKGVENNIIVNARSSSAFGLFWSPEFGPVK